MSRQNFKVKGSHYGTNKFTDCKKYIISSYVVALLNETIEEKTRDNEMIEPKRAVC